MTFGGGGHTMVCAWQPKFHETLIFLHVALGVVMVFVRIK